MIRRLAVVMLHCLPCFFLFALLQSRTLLTAESGSESSAHPVSQNPSDSKYWHPSFDQVSARLGLPQVLLIGDSISIEYTLHVRGLLARVADVHRPPANCESTVLGIRELDRWLGSRQWDVIHFNWGLHELKLVKPGGAENSGLPGKQAVAIEEYEKNLQALVSRLQKTGAQFGPPQRQCRRERVTG
jgi:hypothetical protein